MSGRSLDPARGPRGGGGLDTPHKVPLPPGFGLMDWIRSAPQYAGLPRDVSPEELASHSSERDCWMAVRGVVYDVTPYLPYHPGGVPKLMEGAGKDATALFNQYHAWVNVESMLKRRVVGRLDSSFRLPSASALQPPPATPRKPCLEWNQDDTSMTIVVRTNRKEILRTQHINTFLKHCTLFIYLFLSDHVFSCRYKLQHAVKGVYIEAKNTSLQSTAAATVTLLKRDPGPWTRIGEALPGNRTLCRVKELAREKFPAVLVEKWRVNVNCWKFTFELPPHSNFDPPVGYHTFLSPVHNNDLVRPYTVVPYHFTQSYSSYEPSDESRGQADESDGDKCYVTFLIKLYPDGLFSQALASADEGHIFNITTFDGDFDISRLMDAHDVYLLAAGTGITPMLGIIQYCLLKDFLETRRVRLMFFNRTAGDIILRDELESLQQSHSSSQFSVTHVLSHDEGWAGETGRIREEMVREHCPGLTRDVDVTSTLVCVCGPNPFTDTASAILATLGVPIGAIHLFKS